MSLSVAAHHTNVKWNAADVLVAEIRYLVPALWSVGSSELGNVKEKIFDHLDALDRQVHLGMKLKASQSG